MSNINHNSLTRHQILALCAVALAQTPTAPIDAQTEAPLVVCSEFDENDRQRFLKAPSIVDDDKPRTYFTLDRPKYQVGLSGWAISTLDSYIEDPNMESEPVPFQPQLTQRNRHTVRVLSIEIDTGAVFQVEVDNIVDDAKFVIHTHFPVNSETIAIVLGQIASDESNSGDAILKEYPSGYLWTWNLKNNEVKQFGEIGVDRPGPHRFADWARVQLAGEFDKNFYIPMDRLRDDTLEIVQRSYSEVSCQTTLADRDTFFLGPSESTVIVGDNGDWKCFDLKSGGREIWEITTNDFLVDAGEKIRDIRIPRLGFWHPREQNKLTFLVWSFSNDRYRNRIFSLDLRSGKVEFQFELKNSASVRYFVVSPDEQWAAFQDETVHVANLQTGEQRSLGTKVLGQLLGIRNGSSVLFSNIEGEIVELDFQDRANGDQRIVFELLSPSDER